jgi:ethylene-insensitive protein 2
MQVQRRSHATLGGLFHDHLFSILFTFTGVFLVNYVLLSSAASESSHNVLHTFHDAVDLMNQVCETSFYSSIQLLSIRTVNFLTFFSFTDIYESHGTTCVVSGCSLF